MEMEFEKLVERRRNVELEAEQYETSVRENFSTKFYLG